MAARLVLAFLLIPGIAYAQNPDDAFIGQKAPELTSDDIWVNSKPLKLQDLRGKVVLIDFWAFDCPNCAQAMPYVKEWHKKYAKDGLVIIGVHTPRIDYEKDVAKVKEAVAKKGIEYPVVIDNKYKIWTDYLCAAWPTHYVVDQQGVIQMNHTGVGRYEETEKLIQKLLGKTSDGK
ncbi:MAG: redoxin domain-containing protein [Acidobacteria bacterium]|nr:redoxin domain-containing protein [Acidobacteriota bacterium]